MSLSTEIKKLEIIRDNVPLFIRAQTVKLGYQLSSKEIKTLSSLWIDIVDKLIDRRELDQFKKMQQLQKKLDRAFKNDKTHTERLSEN